MWRTADGNSCQVRQPVSQERELPEKSHRFSRDFSRFRDQFSDSGCPKNRRKARRKRVFAEFLGFPQSPHPLLRLLRLLFFFLSFFPFSPRTENSVCRFAGICRTVPLNRKDTRVVPYNVTFPTVYALCRGAIRRERPASRAALRPSTNLNHFYPVAGERRQPPKSRWSGFCSGAAGNRSTENGCTQNRYNVKIDT